MKYPAFQLLTCLLLAAATARAQPGWSVDAPAFQYGMTLVAQINIDGVPNHALNNHLGLFWGGKIRGYATPVGFAGQAYYYVNLFSNTYKGDSLYVRAFVGADQKVYQSTDTVVFRHHLALGTTGEPVQLHLFLGQRPLIYSLPDIAHAAGAGCTELLDVQASDNVNSEGNGLTYSIQGGADAGKFHIDAQSGLLAWFNFLPNYADPADANGDNGYEVRVRVTDAAGLTDEQLIVVTVVDNAGAPVLTCPPNQTISTSVGGTGDCGGLAGQTQATLGSPCAAANLFYERSGATPGGGSGQIPASQVFNTGLTTVLYYISGGGECAFTVTVQDDEAPTLACPANLTVSPNNTSPCSASGISIDATFGDNCSGPALAFALSGAATAAGSGQAGGQNFPTGTTTVTYTVTDGAGLTAACSFSVTVGACNSQFSGTVLWEHDGASGVQTTTVALTGAGSGSNVTGASGAFLISIPPASGNFTITPSKNINKLNGVTSADVTAIQQHLTNSALLPAPFKRIAADVNKSNSITTLDATLLSQALAGSQSALNQITSWRFVPASYTFPNPNVPWGFPENIALTGVSGGTNLDFKGIKLGDVVSTWANPANFAPPAPLVFWVQDRVLEKGAEVVVDFQAAALEDLTSFQLALWADPAHLQWLGAEALGALPMAAENFGAYKASEGEIRVVWAQPQGFALSAGATVFRLHFRARQSGLWLSELLQIDESVLPAYSYNSALDEAGVELQFGEATGVGVTEDFQVDLQAHPNPFIRQTTLQFILPQAGEAELRVRDAAGRVLFSQKKYYAAGRHEWVLQMDDVGVLFAELLTSSGRAVRRVVGVR